MTGTRAAVESRRARLDGTLNRGDDFGVVLLLILLTIVSFAAASGAIAQLVSVALSGGTLLFVLHTAGARRRVFRFAAVVVTLAVASTAVALVLGEDVGRSLAGLVGLLLAILAPVVILRRIVTASTITVRLVLGALSIYLLLGLAYAYMFPLIATVTGLPFFVQTSTPASVDFVYFSYTTLATIGYGDYTAATSLGRMIAVSEGLVGQLFLVSAVALLVGNVGRTLRQPPPADASRTSLPDDVEVTPPGR